MKRVLLLFVLCAIFAAGCNQVPQALGIETAAVERWDVVGGLDPDLVITRSAPSDWSPDNSKTMDEQLPVPWPEKYVDDYGQNFNPWAYKVNAARLCAYARNNPGSGSEVGRLAEELFDRMIAYTKRQDGARFLIYDFDHTYRQHGRERGWVSGLGNGHAIAGTLALHECWPRARYEDAAHELGEAYKVTSQDDLWFTFVTDDGFLWFEEVAVPGDPQMILNGHISALVGLYYLWDRAGQDPEIEHLLHAGLTSVREYVSEYRRPGQVNCYDLSPPCPDDYSPERTVRHLDVLFRMTGDEYFRTMRDAFADDVGIDTSQYEQDAP